MAEHHRRCSLAQIQAQALHIEGTAGFLADSLQRLEARDGKLVLHISATHHSIIVDICLQQSLCQHDGRYTRDAGITHHNGLCGKAEITADMTCCRTHAEG